MNKEMPFRDYAPHVFRYLRTQVYGVPDAEYLQSVRPSDSKKDIQDLAKAKFSEGRSGYDPHCMLHLSIVQSQRYFYC